MPTDRVDDTCIQWKFEKGYLTNLNIKIFNLFWHSVIIGSGYGLMMDSITPFHDPMQWTYCQKDHEVYTPAHFGRNALNTLRPGQNGCHFTDDVLKYISLNENVWISVNISLKFVDNAPMDNKAAFVQLMAWCWTSDKPLSELMMTQLNDAYTYMYMCLWPQRNVFENIVWVDPFHSSLWHQHPWHWWDFGKMNRWTAQLWTIYTRVILVTSNCDLWFMKSDV